MLEASTAAAEKFAADNIAIDNAHANGTLREWIKEKLDEYRPSDDGEDATSGGSGVGGETLAADSPGT